MVALQTPPVQLRKTASDFKLKSVDGNYYTRDDVKGQNGLLVMFICNHCPFVQAVLPKIIRDSNELKALGIGSVAIMSNNVKAYPDDSFENMQKLSQELNLPFPYLWDETQDIARAYGAVCTPDFFGFNNKLEEQYRGRLDNSGMRNNPSAERDLFQAMAQVAQIGQAPETQYPSIGCSIKWK